MADKGVVVGVSRPTPSPGAGVEVVELSATAGGSSLTTEASTASDSLTLTGSVVPLSLRTIVFVGRAGLVSRRS